MEHTDNAAGGGCRQGGADAFWSHVGRYASCTRDEAFAGEVAYVMVTLHRTGV